MGYYWTMLPPYNLAAVRNHSEMVNFLLAEGSDIEGKTTHGYTPLHASVLFGAQEIVKLLLDRGADVDTQDWRGYNPLHTAVVSRLVWGIEIKTVVDILSLLLSHNANYRGINDHNQTPKQFAYSFNGPFSFDAKKMISVLERWEEQALSSSNKENFPHTPSFFSASSPFIEENFLGGKTRVKSADDSFDGTPLQRI
jgi:ankyrin repeat protein